MKQINAEDLPAELAEIGRRLSEASLDAPLGECVPVLRAGVSDNFEAAVGSDGTPWPPRKLNASRVVPVSGLDESLLVDTGPLRDAAAGDGAGAVARILGGRTLLVGVDKSVHEGGLPGAAAHNFGHPPGNLSQREYLYAPPVVLDRTVVVLAEGVLTEIFVF